MKKILLSVMTSLAVISTAAPAFASAESSEIDISALVAESPDFPNGEMIYSDKYRFAVEDGTMDKYLVVYGMEYSETLGYTNDHLVFNTKDYRFAFDISFDREFYSGRVYFVGSSKYDLGGILQR
ncbi:MAG: hypothetical protein IJX77_03300 [Ruminococcus sp.]|nr:hypothetical protein [Ruminococcus sp.]